MNTNHDDTNETSSQPEPTHRPVRKVYETFRINPGIAGWYFVPADPEHMPLLVQLFGYDPKTLTSEDRLEMRKPQSWADLEEGLALVQSIARDQRIGVRICGNRKRHPVVQLWAKPRREPTPVLRPFAGLGGDGAKWGVTDFYAEHEHKLREALATRLPFDTGWYAVKKEIQSGRIRREHGRLRPDQRGGRLHIEVSASMDDWPDLVDTAVWEALGKALGASGGYDTLLKLGLDEKQADAWLQAVVDDLASSFDLEQDNARSASAVLAPNARYKRLCERLDALMDECEEELKRAYDLAVEHCRRRLLDLKRERGASCTNCRHFHAAIGATRRTPEDPADCGHPKHYALLSANRNFPFEHGCKFWVVKAQPPSGN